MAGTMLNSSLISPLDSVVIKRKTEVENSLEKDEAENQKTKMRPNASGSGGGFSLIKRSRGPASSSSSSVETEKRNNSDTKTVEEDGHENSDPSTNTQMDDIETPPIPHETDQNSSSSTSSSVKRKQAKPQKKENQTLSLINKNVRKGRLVSTSKTTQKLSKNGKRATLAGKHHAGVEKKKRHFRPSTVCFRNMLRERVKKSTEPVFPKRPFYRLVREIANDTCLLDGGIRFRKEALECLREASEAFIADMFEDTSDLTDLRGNQTLQPKELNTWLKLVAAKQFPVMFKEISASVVYRNAKIAHNERLTQNH